MSGSLAVGPDEVRSASRLIAGIAVRTPLLEYRELSDIAGSRILVKFEVAQHTGSFKFRGAYNRLARIEKPARRMGVVPWSSGNHAQGVAAAAKRLDLPAVIVMPSDARRIKISNTERLGAQIVFYERGQESREEIAARLAVSTGATLVPSFDDPFIIAGQGTVDLEILEQAQDAGARIGRVLVCCGGGGLIAGMALQSKRTRPKLRCIVLNPRASTILRDRWSVDNEKRPNKV